MATIRRFASFYFCIGLLVALSGFVTYTPDLVIYEDWIASGASRDIFFNVVANIVNSNSLGYKTLHLFYITLSALTLTYIAGIFSFNRVMLVVVWIMLEYFQFTTQIRFFPSYFLAIIAIYMFDVKRRKLVGAIIFIAAAANHMSVVLLPVMYYIFIAMESNFKKNILRVSYISVLAGYFYYFYAQPVLDVLIAAYILNQDNISSLAGGIYSSLGGIFGLAFVFMMGTWGSVKQAMQGGDYKLRFLYCVSLMPVIILIPGLFFKVLNDRFLDAGILFTLMFILSASRYVTKGKAFTLFMALNLVVFNFWTRYFQDFFIFGSMRRFNESLAILSSIQFN
ncbi:hypothetical protein N9J84_04895 [Porticoccaceae bacterium]|nr:hypothetical protein [Porticoccaceae bacterium]